VFIKIFSVLRSYIGFGLIGILMPVILWGYGIGSAHMTAETLGSDITNNFLIVGKLTNGFTAAYFIMNFFYIHVPFLIVLAGGDIFAGEAARGTFRLYTTRPVSRTSVFISKIIGANLYTVMMIIFIALTSLGLGVVWHGGGDMLVFQDGILILSQEDAGLRFLLAYGLAFVNMSLVITLSIFFSVIVRNAVGPVVGAMAVIIFAFALTSLPLEIFDNVRPFIFTTYFDTWKYAFYEPIGWRFISRGLMVTGGYITVITLISYIIFNRKDILS